jgi:hypothetical protein
VPITITPAPPTNFVGYGIFVSLTSDFVGPLPSGSFFRLTLSSDPEGDVPILIQTIPTLNPGLETQIGSEQSGQSYTSGQNAVAVGATVHVLAELHSPTATIDSGVTTATWQPTTNLGQHITLASQAQSTPNDARIDQILAAVVRQLQDQN